MGEDPAACEDQSHHHDGARRDVVGTGIQNWLPDRHAEIAWKRWVAYKQLLTLKGFTPGVLNALDASTDEIVNCLGDPLVDGSWKRRGLVIGDVQSGKTATYSGR